MAICGSPRNYNTPEMLRTKRFAELMARLREMADYVIVDTPPSSILADVQAIANYSDAIVYIICQDYTTKNALNAGINNLASTGKRFIGYVLNNAGTSATGQSYAKNSKHSAYGSYGSYGRYGTYGGRSKYGKYGRRGKNSKQGSYGTYGTYGGYGKYGKYGGSYGKYGSYGAYGAYGAYGKDQETETAADTGGNTDQ